MQLFLKILIFYILLKATSLYASEQIKVISDKDTALKILLNDEVVTIKDIKFKGLILNDTIIKNKILIMFFIM